MTIIAYLYDNDQELMEIHRKHYKDLTLDELYGLLQLRSEVFVVEQDCPYQDLDGNDRNAVHVFAGDGSRILACLRVFLKDDGDASIGRVVTSKEVRGTGLGRKLMMEGISCAREMYPGLKCVIHAQRYATGFYEKCGFSVSSDEFLEDGIPHVEMQLVL